MLGQKKKKKEKKNHPPKNQYLHDSWQGGEQGNKDIREASILRMEAAPPPAISQFNRRAVGTLSTPSVSHTHLHRRHVHAHGVKLKHPQAGSRRRQTCSSRCRGSDWVKYQRVAQQKLPLRPHSPVQLGRFAAARLSGGHKNSKAGFVHLKRTRLDIICNRVSKAAAQMSCCLLPFYSYFM